VATILIIDDERVVRSVIARVLTVRGYTVLEAGGVDEGLALCAALGDTLDLLIAEPALPSVSGEAFADQVLRRCPNAKILYISGWPFQILGRRQESLPPGTFLQKPFSAPKLVNAVETALHSPAEGTRTRRAGS
jgi:two-component system cell cycle sensor histidine kinase/response regulator CckA